MRTAGTASAHLEMEGCPSQPPVSSSQRSCCPGYPGSVPEKANHINDTQGSARAREGSQVGPHRPPFLLCSGGGLQPDPQCKRRGGILWGSGREPGRTTAGIYHVYLQKRTQLHTCLLDFRNPSVQPHASPKECEECGCLSLGFTATQTDHSLRGLLMAASWAEIF